MASRLSLADAAAGAGVAPAYLERVVELTILTPADGGFTVGDVRRLAMLRSLEDAGLPLEAIADGLRRGVVSLDFAESPSYARFASFADETFEQVSARTGVPIELLSVLREAIGLPAPAARDRVREDELAVVRFLELEVRLGISTAAAERLLRAQVDSLRRIAEAEAEWFRTAIVEPIFARGGSMNEVATIGTHTGLDSALDDAIVALYHSQTAQTWMANITAGFEGALNAAGIHAVPSRLPAICFLDITGYTRLTQERGDAAAAAVAEELARLVNRSSIQHGGRPVKWLGDGVMFWFREPGPAVASALEMVDGIGAAGLPPAHVGVHAGPVVMQQGDYYGQTVNMAARIADYARPGEVLVSQAVVDATSSDGTATPGGIEFAEIGPVELKGVAGVVRLHAARRPAG